MQKPKHGVFVSAFKYASAKIVHTYAHDTPKSLLCLRLEQYLEPNTKEGIVYAIKTYAKENNISYDNSVKTHKWDLSEMLNANSELIKDNLKTIVECGIPHSAYNMGVSMIYDYIIDNSINNIVSFNELPENIKQIIKNNMPMTFNVDNNPMIMSTAMQISALAKLERRSGGAGGEGPSYGQFAPASGYGEF
jgi:hypothetical protein